MDINHCAEVRGGLSGLCGSLHGHDRSEADLMDKSLKSFETDMDLKGSGIS